MRRQLAELTQAELAARLHRPQSFVAKYESGTRRIEVIELLDLAEALGFDPVELLAAVQHTPARKGRGWRSGR